MYKKILMALLALSILVPALAVAQDQFEVAIPRNVTIKGIPVAQGTYYIALVDGEAGKMLRLSNADGTEILTELAIVVTAEKPTNYPVVMYQPLRREQDRDLRSKDPLVGRVFIQTGDTIYLLYCEK
jgi:hypothetical protein